jgi:tRNA(fMet)-specific endonuclease VapC
MLDETLISMDYLLDTNIISATLKQNQTVLEKTRLIRRFGGKTYISTINYYEVKRGLLASQASHKLRLFHQLLQDYEVLGIDEVPVLEKAAAIYVELKQRGELLPDADILIAAVAQVHDLVLVTDDNHFNRISGLRLENWVRD